jgi:acyl-homoserine-lactone acylase
MDSWAAGLNYYLATHPQVHPRVITRFEPWMALSFTEGSIGGDIERIDLGDLEKFYSGRKTVASVEKNGDPTGSNGIAIAPAITRDGNALLLINPHTSFFFRSELQMTSGDGLNAYGAATWGQFFIYQGFNEHAGWMHTSSGIDNVDEFAVDVRQPELGPRYRYGREWRPMQERDVTLRFRKSDGTFGSQKFTTYRTHHGPIVRRGPNGRWIAFAMMDKPVTALEQSFLRTKTKDLADFLKVAELKSNSSNNTMFADDKGEIAYLHPQFVPTRNDKFDYEKPVDGSDPATDWGPLHALNELPSVLNPPVGWVQNTNAWPYLAAGPNSPDPKRFPKYMDVFGENWRGLHAQQLLNGTKGWTLDRLQAAAFDSYQPGFADLIPPLIKAYDALPKKDPRRERLSGPISLLRGWNYRWSAGSPAQSIAMFYGDELLKALNPPASEESNKVYMRMAKDTTPVQRLQALADAAARIKKDFGWTQVPWGEINRFQRISPAIDHPFSDAASSTPIPFAWGVYGSLAASSANPKPGTRKWYGTSGNSFVAVVEFGKRVRARAVTAGGESGNPMSKHFNDEAERYATGNLREVYFYPDQLQGHTERRYRPGE